MSIKEEYYRRKTDEKAEINRKISDSWKVKLKDPVTLFTGVLAIVAIFQLAAMRSTDEATHTLAEAALKQSGTMERQAIAMQGQLDAMVREQRPFIWITNSPTGPEFVRKRNAAPQEDTGQIIWNWEFTNLGKTFAKSFTYDHFLKIGDTPYKRSYGASEANFGGTIPPGKISFSTAISDPGMSQQEFNRLMFVDGGIGLLIDFVYFDGVENRYTDSICIARLASGAVSYPDPASCKK